MSKSHGVEGKEREKHWDGQNVFYVPAEREAFQHKGQAMTQCFGQGTATFSGRIPVPQQRAKTCAQSDARLQSGGNGHGKRKVSVSNGQERKKEKEKK